MRYKTITFLFSIVLVMGSTAALSISQEPLEEMLENTTEEELEEVRQAFNQNNDQLPGFAGDLIGGQRVNVYIETNESEEEFRAELEGTRITALEEDEWEDPSLEVRTDTSTITEIVNAEQPVPALKASIDSGDITYQEHGLVNQVRFFLARTFLGL